MVRRLVVGLLLLVLAVPAWAAEVPPGGTFTDDDGSDHEGAIEALVANGVTQGCGAGLFCPDASVTRGQMAALLHRAVPDLKQGEPVSFGDTSGSLFESDIEWLAATGVTRGCNPPANTLFCPDAPVTRGQMAAFLVRALGYTSAGSDQFSDDDASVFEADIERLAAAGVTTGCTETRFCPDDLVTRAQMASFLARALAYDVPEVPGRVTDPVSLSVPEVSVCDEPSFVDLLEGIPWDEIYGPGYSDLGPLGTVYVFGYDGGSSSVDLEWQAFGGEPTVTGYDSEYGEVIHRKGGFSAWSLTALQFPPVGPAETVIDRSFGSATIDDLYFSDAASAAAIQFRISYDEDIFHLGECTSAVVISD